MPTRLRVVAIVFCAAGALGLLDTLLTALTTLTLQLNAGAFLLPVGIGLLHGKHSSRRWATFWIVLAAVLAATVSVLTVVQPSDAYVRWPGGGVGGMTAAGIVLALVAATEVLLAVMLWSLHSRPVREYLARGRDEDSAARAC